MQKPRVLSALCTALLVAIISVPAVQMMCPLVEEKPLLGWVPDGQPRPNLTVDSFVNGGFQRWASSYLSDHAGFRPTMVRTYNEMVYRLSGEAPTIGVFNSDGRLFTSEQILSISKTFTNRERYKKAFREDAVKLKLIQDDLASKGKYFVVLLAASKPAIYIDAVPSRFWPSGLTKDFDVNGLMADELLRAGVNVIDGSAVMRRLRDKGIQTHPDSGVHWNYFSGCLIASEVMSQAEANVPGRFARIGCGVPDYSDPAGADDDALQLINIWSDGGVRTATPKPQLSLEGSSADLPRIVIVGDSFSWQVISAMSYSSSYSSLVYSGYLRSRFSIKAGTGEHLISEGEDVPQSKIVSEVARDIEQSDIVVLQQVDYVRTPIDNSREDDWFGFMHHMTSLINAIPSNPAVGR